MKRFFPFLFYLAVLVSCIVFSCRKGTEDLPEFVTVERIVNGNPGLAIHLLAEMEPRAKSFDEATRMRYELLKIRAHDKNYEPLRSDSVILSSGITTTVTARPTSVCRPIIIREPITVTAETLRRPWNGIGRRLRRQIPRCRISMATSITAQHRR